MSVHLIDGSEAIARSAIAAGARFFAGYPMSPATDLLEHFSRLMPQSAGVCINAETEIESVNMAIGAAMTGFRAATGSCGQGLALMQEAFGEAALNESPLVVFNMARSQQDYFQATRGGGWGDYRTITLAPKDVPEAVEHTQLLFHLADRYRAPVILMADNLIARTQASVSIEPRDFGELPEKDWIIDGSSSGSGRSRQVWTWGVGKHNTPGVKPEVHWTRIADKFAAVAATEARHETGFADDAEVLVVAYGTAAKFVEHVVRELRAEGRRIGWFRPVTLWPFPEAALIHAARNVREILVFEINAGQMIDDVRIALGRDRPIRAIGGISTDEWGLNLGPLLDAPVLRERIERAMAGVTA